jgi:hypothetical protein
MHRSGCNVVGTYYTDSPNLTAFGELRVADPQYVFDSSFEYDLQPLLFEAITQDAGAGITHDNKTALHTFSAVSTGAEAILQTYDYHRYQPGRSQKVLLTFNFVESAADVTKFVGYSDGDDGIELQQVGSTVQITLLSTTSAGDQTATQSNWNLDTLDGTGQSGITLDWTKGQILIIDLQWLSLGRVRIGFDIEGRIIFAHEFLNANVIAVPYMRTANLPVRAGMTSAGDASTTMRFICASVVSEGGQEDVLGFGFCAEGTATAASGARTHILSIRPKTTFNSITNRSKFILNNIDVVSLGNNAVLWELVLGQAISGTTTFNDVNTYSTFEYNSAGTISGSPTIVIAQGYSAGTNQAKSPINEGISLRYPITLDAAGNQRLLGTVSLLVTGLGGSTSTRAGMTWREIR